MLTSEEKRWFSIFWRLNYRYKELIQKQIENATFTREYTDYYIFLNICVPKDVEPLPHLDTRVPIAVLVSHVATENCDMGGVYGLDSVPAEAGENGEEPTDFMLHIYDGYVRQLEIYNVDSSRLNRSKLCEGRKDYRLSKLLLL